MAESISQWCYVYVNGLALETGNIGTPLVMEADPMFI